jgi:sucrose-phosphate synthase
MEREQGRKDATADMSSDLSEGERDSTPVDSMPRVESSLTLSSSGPGEESNLTLSSSSPGEASAPDREKPAKQLYIVLIRCVRE